MTSAECVLSSACLGLWSLVAGLWSLQYRLRCVKSALSCRVSSSSNELPGLTARLDKLVHHHGGASLPPDKPHAFVYYITIRNRSNRTVTLLGRKWVVDHADGTRLVIEGDKIVGETPRLAPGEQFSYNSYHVTGVDAAAQGSFHGVDDLGGKIHVILPSFELTIPPT